MNEKSRCGGLWTESRYRSFITSALRSAFRRWGPKAIALREAFVERRTNPKSGRLANHYKCAECKKSFPQKQVQVDHKTPIGIVVSWDKFIEDLFCEVKNLQVLCKPCHKFKTKKETKKRLKKNK